MLDPRLYRGPILDDIGSHLEVLEDGEAGEDAPALGHQAQAFLVDMVGGHLGDVLAHEAHGALPGVEEPGDGAQGRRLARAVAPDEGDDLPLLDGEGYAFEGVDLAVIGVDLVQLE